MAVDPRYLLGKLNLADALLAIGEPRAAVPVYREAVGLDPSSLDGQTGLAESLLRTGEIAAAIAVCRAALQQSPGSVRGLHLLAVALGKAGDHSAAIAAEQAALARDPQFAKGWHALGTLWDEVGDARQAAEAYRRALAIDPTLVEAAFDLAALTGDSPPPAMPRGYATRLFDDFAATFEQRLVAELDYQVPAALRAEVGPLVSSRAGESLALLDLGCGTGLVGRAFRDLDFSMVGVDLSPAMLAQARTEGIYSELVCDDVVHYLATTERRFDLILAADLFIYIGDLRKLFAAARRILTASGWLAFSIEELVEGEFLLRRTRRYAHALELRSRLGAGAWLPRDRHSQPAAPPRRGGAGRRADCRSPRGRVIGAGTNSPGFSQMVFRW